MPLLGTKDLGQLHRFVDHHTIGNIDAVFKLVDADAQNGPFNRVDLLNPAVKHLAAERIEFAEALWDLMQQLVEILNLNLFHVLLFHELLVDVSQVLTGHLPLIKRLQGTLACKATGTAHKFILRGRVMDMQ